MTIALVIKVNDGLVLAADSATTMTVSTPGGSTAVWNIYNNANKVFNLHKGLPIGAATWGLGNIGPASIATLAKDMRQAFHGEGPRASWKLDPDDYTIKDVANQVQGFLYDDEYRPLVEAVTPEDERPSMGFLIGGYSSGSDEPEAYVMTLGEKGVSPVALETLAGTTGAQWWGQPEALSRLLTGVSLFVPGALKNLGVGVDDSDRNAFAEALRSQVQVTLIPPAMPIQDAIDLAHFMVDTTIKFVHFMPGDKVVGGPIEIATITKHEGFKWVSRKHFFDAALNPPTEVR